MEREITFQYISYNYMGKYVYCILNHEVLPEKKKFKCSQKKKNENLLKLFIYII